MNLSNPLLPLQQAYETAQDGFTIAKRAILSHLVTITEENLTMTPLLEQAVIKVTQLPSFQQDAIASLILEELVDEIEWDNQFAQSQDQLAKLAQKAREDYKAGRVRKMGMDEI